MKFLLPVLFLGISFLFSSSLQANEMEDLVKLNDSHVNLSRINKLNSNLRTSERAKITTSIIQSQERIIEPGKEIVKIPPADEF